VIRSGLLKKTKKQGSYTDVLLKEEMGLYTELTKYSTPLFLRVRVVVHIYSKYSL
jgi:hypothetical protein